LKKKTLPPKNNIKQQQEVAKITTKGLKRHDQPGNSRGTPVSLRSGLVWIYRMKLL